MKLNRIILFILLFIFKGFCIYSQTKGIDSLKLLLVPAKEDTNKAETLLNLAWYSNNAGEYKNALNYGKTALALAEKLEYKKGIRIANYQLATSYGHLLNYSESIKYLYTDLKIYEQLGDKEWTSACLQEIGGTLFLTGDTTTAIAYYLKALKLRKEIGLKWGIAQTYNAVGELYLKQGRYNEALQQHFAALEILKEPEPDVPGWSPAYTHECFGNVYHAQGDSAYAAENKKYAAAKYKDALQHFLTSLDYWKKFGQADAIPYMYVPIGNMYAKLNNTLLAKDYLSKATKLALQLEDKEVLRSAYLGLSVLDSLQGNYKQAYKNYKLYILYRDSIINDETVKKVEGYKAQYDFDKKEDSLKQKQVITETKLKSQKKQNYFYLTGLLMLALLSFFVFSNLRKQKKINGLAAEAHARENAEMELKNLHAISSERLRISSDLHDEVGATLSGIAMYSHLTKEQIKQSNLSGINSSLDIMQQNSSQMVDKLNDIVWFINPEQDTLKQLLTRLEDYTYKMAAIKDIKTIIKKPESPGDIQLATELRRNIYLFCKEAVNNAVKHSGATLLEFSVSDNNGLFEFEIKDNGKAFDTGAANGGNGMGNMQKRAEALGGEMEVVSSLGNGTAIKLLIKIPR